MMSHGFVLPISLWGRFPSPAGRLEAAYGLLTVYNATPHMYLRHSTENLANSIWSHHSSFHIPPNYTLQTVFLPQVCIHAGSGAYLLRWQFLWCSSLLSFRPNALICLSQPEYEQGYFGSWCMLSSWRILS
jgi:hypothetical protein